MRYFTERDRLGILVALIDDSKDLDLKPSAHIFLKDKPAWFQLPDDGIQRCQEFNAEFAERLEELQREKAGAS